MFIHRDRQQSGSVVIRPLSITQLPCMAVSQICQSIRALCQSASQSAADRPLCHDQSVRPLCHDQTVSQTTVSDHCVRPLYMCQTTVSDHCVGQSEHCGYILVEFRTHALQCELEFKNLIFKFRSDLLNSMGRQR